MRYPALAACRLKQAAQHAVVFQALSGAGALDDFSHDDQGTETALGLIVGGRHLWTTKAGQKELCTCFTGKAEMRRVYDIPERMLFPGPPKYTALPSNRAPSIRARVCNPCPDPDRICPTIHSDRNNICAIAFSECTPPRAGPPRRGGRHIYRLL